MSGHSSFVSFSFFLLFFLYLFTLSPISSVCFDVTSLSCLHFVFFTSSVYYVALFLFFPFVFLLLALLFLAISCLCNGFSFPCVSLYPSIILCPFSSVSWLLHLLFSICLIYSSCLLLCTFAIIIPAMVFLLFLFSASSILHIISLTHFSYTIHLRHHHCHALLFSVIFQFSTPAVASNTHLNHHLFSAVLSLVPLYLRPSSVSL